MKSDTVRGLAWANLVHLSNNMWDDMPPRYQPYLRFSEKLWKDILEEMSRIGMNMVVLDLGDGVIYDSHPEIAVENAWSVEKLKGEIGRAEDLGIEIIPKLNFSAAHDAWLGEYSRCISTDTYYQVVGDLISEVIDIFDKPRFVHLGMDEEAPRFQDAHRGKRYRIMMVRQHDLWWHDLEFLFQEVQSEGVRPWIWQAGMWFPPEFFEPDTYVERMPKSVLQSNWYYGEDFGEDNFRVRSYDILEKNGYDQIPGAGTHSSSRNFEMTVSYCLNVIDPSRLYGFLQTTWKPATEEYRQVQMEAISQVGRTISNL